MYSVWAKTMGSKIMMLGFDQYTNTQVSSPRSLAASPANFRKSCSVGGHIMFCDWSGSLYATLLKIFGMSIRAGLTVWVSPTAARILLYNIMGQNLDWSMVQVPWTIEGVRQALESSPVAARYCRALAEEMHRRYPDASSSDILDMLFIPPPPGESAYLLWLGNVPVA